MQITTRVIKKYMKSGNIFSSITLDYEKDGKKINQFQCEKYLDDKQKYNLHEFLKVKKQYDLLNSAKCDFKTRLGANTFIKTIREKGSDIQQVSLQILEDRQEGVTFL